MKLVNILKIKISIILLISILHINFIDSLKLIYTNNNAPKAGNENLNTNNNSTEIKKCNKTKTTTKNDEEIVPKKEGNR